jgi:hypothetical protein
MAVKKEHAPAIQLAHDPFDGERSIHYIPSSEEIEAIRNRFTYHPPSAEQRARYETIREYAHEFALQLLALVPPGEQRDVALVRLEEAVMHANAGVAREGT